MEENLKQLLLKDLCARLPYGVKVHLSRKHNRPEEDIVLNNIIIGKDGFVTSNIIGYNYLLSEIKPYLRPMSSMTEEELHEYNMHLLGITIGVDVMNFMIWIYQHHLDILHFIEKGLALEAPKGMYKLKEL